MSEAEAIHYWNRRTGRTEREQVYGDAMVRWLYGTQVGQRFAHAVVTRRGLSRLVGWYQSSPLSRGAIEPFVRQFGIPLDEYEPGPFRSFNQFFVRRFRAGARRFAVEPGVMSAFAEARYLAFEAVRAEDTFPVKGEDLCAAAILQRSDWGRCFAGGPLLIARLCPVDYHRFHYPDEGRTADHYRVPGRLHSVNPLALRARSDIFATNERRVSILESAHFGRLAYVEVGALCVGRIVQTHPADQPFRRGDEKGYFLFGASTVILLGEAGGWKPCADLLEQTRMRRETLVRLGEPVAGR